MKLVIAGACLALALGAAPARAQSLLPFGFSALPSFAWPELGRGEARRWEGSYARMSTGFAVSSSRHFGTVAGPTVGAEAGRYWRQGDLVLGLSGGFDYMAPFGHSGIPAFGRIAYSRDFAGGFQVKAGTLVTEDVLVYTRAGVAAINETYRFGGSLARPSFSRNDIAVRPDAGVGVEWAITDRLTLGLEVGATGAPVR